MDLVVEMCWVCDLVMLYLESFSVAGWKRKAVEIEVWSLKSISYVGFLLSLVARSWPPFVRDGELVES